MVWLLKGSSWCCTENRLLISNSSNFFTLINHSNSSKTPFQKTRLVVSRGNSSGKQSLLYNFKMGKQNMPSNFLCKSKLLQDTRSWSDHRAAGKLQPLLRGHPRIRVELPRLQPQVSDTIQTETTLLCPLTTRHRNSTQWFGAGNRQGCTCTQGKSYHPLPG